MFYRNCLFAAVISTFVFSVKSAAEFPSSIERCAAGDTKCLATLITKLMAGSANGIPELGLKSLDPFYFGTGSVSQQNDGPVSMNISIHKGSIYGWSKMKVNKVIGFEKDPRTSTFELHCYVPLDQIIGEYDLSGRALLVPVVAKGAINITLEHVDMKVIFHTTVVSKDGEDYLKLKKMDVNVDAKMMHTKFENLFKDKAISDNANSLMNQYQEALFTEIRQSFGIARATTLAKALKPAFEKYPYRTWKEFPEIILKNYDQGASM